MPAYFPENNTSLATDDSQRSLQKIVALAGGGSGGTYAAGGNFFGVGSPEGVVAANRGAVYTNTATGTLFVKTTDTVNTGWL